MTSYYLDSSVLVKRYVNETGSEWVQALCDSRAGHVPALAHVGLVEVAAALGVKHRQGLLPEAVLDGLLRDLQRDSFSQYWLIDVDQQIVLQAIALTRRQRLRGYDAIHLAFALFLQETLTSHTLPPPIFLSADRDLLSASQREGLTSDDPNVHM